MSIEDPTIPSASVARIIKSILPEHIQISKDAKHAFAKAAGIFVLYVTAAANDCCRDMKRQTILAKDVMAAMQEIDFDDFVEPLDTCLKEYREEVATKKRESKALKAEAGKAKASIEAATAAAIAEANASANSAAPAMMATSVSPVPPGAEGESSSSSSSSSSSGTAVSADATMTDAPGAGDDAATNGAAAPVAPAAPEEAPPADGSAAPPAAPSSGQSL